ncbi:pilus assembly protein [Mesorhizobium sp. LHD-90]|uniref:TadE/TadG family type IV pilus assembly protein n=1 Tax=Mesorhizobium sp. LHD-90 TaxID=3071414 RepID=UPI0027DF03B2|nr:pilus assembly protein [Mesorhizobium sp. LHD-90]MDQ6435755.1 pilus assembly protein [Mesorhizobium sp. LHD-90]
MGRDAMGSAPHNDSIRTNSRPGSLLGRFLHDSRGATAIEFAMLAIPFSLMVFAILESCISFGGSQILTNATDDIARQFRTGQIRTINETDLKTMVCDRIKIIVENNCPGLVVDLRKFDTFAEAADVRLKFTADNDLDTAGFKVELGPAQTINMLRVFYKWPVMTDFMSLAMSNLKDGKTLHFAEVVWKNEPFN